MNQAISVSKRKANSDQSMRDFYAEQLKFAPKISELIGSGTMISERGGEFSEVRSASDYSYSSSFYGGSGFRIAGDAGAFIDPYFSSGVHLALCNGLSAAASICASIRGDCTESEAGKWHSDRVGSSYTWFLMVVLGAYKQIRAQEEPIMADINERDYDRAFKYLRPGKCHDIRCPTKSDNEEKLFRDLLILITSARTKNFRTLFNFAHALSNIRKPSPEKLSSVNFSSQMGPNLPVEQHLSPMKTAGFWITSTHAKVYARRIARSTLRIS